MSSFAFALDDKNNRRITDENLTWCITPLNKLGRMFKGVASIECRTLLWGSSPVPNWVHLRSIRCSLVVCWLGKEFESALEKTRVTTALSTALIHPEFPSCVPMQIQTLDQATSSPPAESQTSISTPLLFPVTRCPSVKPTLCCVLL